METGSLMKVESISECSNYTKSIFRVRNTVFSEIITCDTSVYIMEHPYFGLMGVTSYV